MIHADRWNATRKLVDRVSQDAGWYEALQHTLEHPCDIKVRMPAATVNECMWRRRCEGCANCDAGLLGRPKVASPDGELGGRQPLVGFVAGLTKPQHAQNGACCGFVNPANPNSRHDGGLQAPRVGSFLARQGAANGGAAIFAVSLEHGMCRRGRLRAASGESECSVWPMQGRSMPQML